MRCCVFIKPFLLSGERRELGVGTGCKLVVKHVYAHAVVADERKLVDEGTAVVFFLYLLRYEPLEPVASGVVLFFFCESEQAVNKRCYLALVFEGSLEGVKNGSP